MKTNSRKYRMLTYGLQDDTRRNASSIIEEKWRIEFYAVAGCIVTEEVQDSVKRENEKTYKLIEAAYGKNWEEKFDAEIETEYKIEAQIDSLVKGQPYIRDKEIINPFPGAPFPMYPSDKTGNYIVTVNTYNREWKGQKLYKLKVNYKKNLVEIVKDYTLIK